jgi:hypothetical protein
MTHNLQASNPKPQTMIAGTHYVTPAGGIINDIAKLSAEHCDRLEFENILAATLPPPAQRVPPRYTRPEMPPPGPPEKVKAARSRATVNSSFAAKRMRDFLERNGMTQPKFAELVNTSDRTIRSFGKTGKVRKDIFSQIAKVMGTTPEDLLREAEK